MSGKVENGIGAARKSRPDFLWAGPSVLPRLASLPSLPRCATGSFFTVGSLSHLGEEGGGLSHSFRMTSIPPIHGRRTAGTRMLPSACWQFSMIAIIVRGSASPDPLSVCTSSGLAPFSGR
jgi:hypothetical protein